MVRWLCLLTLLIPAHFVWAQKIECDDWQRLSPGQVDRLSYFAGHWVAGRRDRSALSEPPSLSLISGDGRVWDTTDVPITGEFAHSDTIFLATSQGVPFTLYRSEDLQHWEALEHEDGAATGHLAFDGTYFWRVGSTFLRSSLERSLDGRTWEDMPYPETEEFPHEMSAGQGYLLFHSPFEASKWLRTPDGTWYRNPFPGQVSDIAFGPDRVMAVVTNSEGQFELHHSEDGINWELLRERTLPFISYSQDQFQLYGFRDEIWQVEAGLQINEVKLDHGQPIHRFHIAAGQELLITQFGSVGWRDSENPLQWLSPGQGFQHIFAQQDRLLLMGRFHVAEGLPDGQWAVYPTQEGDRNFEKVVRWGDGFIGVGSNGLATSSDGLLWDEVLPQFGFKDLVIHEQKILALAVDQMAMSEDGDHWDLLPLPMPGTVAVGHDGKQFLALTNGGLLATSEDARQWQAQQLPVSGQDTRFRIFTHEEQVFLEGFRQLWRNSEGVFYPTIHADNVTRSGSFYSTSGFGAQLSSDGETWQPVADFFPAGQVDVEALYEWGGRVYFPRRSNGAAFELMSASCSSTAALVRGRSMVVPWMVHNPNWQSQVALANRGDQPAVFSLVAVDQQGVRAENTLTLEPQAALSRTAEELFPGMNGFSLTLHSDVPDVFADYQTLYVADGPPAPSRAKATLFGEAGSQLLFPYLPADQTTAVVLCAPTLSEGQQVTVQLQLVDAFGGAFETELQLEGPRPNARLVSALFPDASLPEAMALKAESNGVPLAGTTFYFNKAGHPAMAAAITLD